MASTGGGGPVAAVKRIVETVLAMGLARVQLIGNEIQIEKHRAIGQLVRVVLALWFVSLAVVLAIGLVLALMWDQRVAVLGVLVATLLLAAGWLAWSVKRSFAVNEHPFAASLAELQEDLRQLKASAGNGPRQESR